MSDKLNIFQKLSAITAELQTVAKNLEVNAGSRNSYKAVSERDVIDAVKPLENKYGVYSYPCAREILESCTLESENDYQGKVTKKTTFFSRIQTTYRFVNVDNPNEFIETTVFSEGIDPQDKGSGKAMTYGDKYALMKAYKISTGDDPDQNASEEVKYTKRAQTAKAAEHICSECNCKIQPVTSKNGEVWEADKIASYSQRKFGRVMCPDCQKKQPKE